MKLCFVNHNGIRLAYRVQGNGLLVVLVQGLGLSGEMWLGLPGGLLKSGYRVVTPDARGTGQSDVPCGIYTTNQLADDLAAIIEDVGEGPAIVVGISLGGMIAQKLALRHPHLVLGLVLGATSPGTPFGLPPAPGFLAMLPRFMIKGPVAIHKPLQKKLVHPDSLKTRPNLFEVYDKVYWKAPTQKAGILGHLTAASLHSTGISLKKIHCPTEIITGDSDKVIFPANSRVLARLIPHGQLTIVPKAGHFFLLEYPRVVPAAIKNIVQKIPQIRMRNRRKW